MEFLRISSTILTFVTGLTCFAFFKFSSLWMSEKKPEKRKTLKVKEKTFFWLFIVSAIFLVSTMATYAIGRSYLMEVLFR